MARVEVIPMNFFGDVHMQHINERNIAKVSFTLNGTRIVFEIEDVMAHSIREVMASRIAAAIMESWR